MKSLFIVLAIIAFPTISFAGDLPSLLCTPQSITFVPFEDIRHPVSSKTRTVYSIQSGKLYVNDFGKPEYLYGDINKNINSDRYVSNNKTIIFSSDFSKANVVHIDTTGTQISEWHCQFTQ